MLILQPDGLCECFNVVCDALELIAATLICKVEENGRVWKIVI